MYVITFVPKGKNRTRSSVFHVNNRESSVLIPVLSSVLSPP